MIIYIQIHMLYNSKIIKFDLIIHDVMNEKHRIFIIKKGDVIIFVYHNNKTNNSLKAISTALISLIAKHIFFIRSLIVNLSIFLLNVESNFFI